jgi:hypothetical protein
MRSGPAQGFNDFSLIGVNAGWHHFTGPENGGNRCASQIIPAMSQAHASDMQTGLSYSSLWQTRQT